jgi:hypothetical protein
MRLPILFLFFIGHSAVAQNVAGLWTGRFTSLSPINSMSYKYELLIFQKGKDLSGFSYSTSGNDIFYFVSEITGKLFDDYMVITETKTVYANITAGEEIAQTHILFFSGTGDITDASGDWKEAKPKRRMFPEEGRTFMRKTDDHSQSGLINVLREKKVIAVEPELKTEEPPVTKPVVKDTVAVNRDSLKLASREKEILRTIEFRADSVLLELYDDGIVDGDSVSVYVNNTPVIAKQELGTKPVRLSISLKNNSNETIVSMYAENQGRIPPNTGLLIMKDGEKRYEIRFSSDTKKTAAVKLVRKQK